jgi:hypothetical protein
MPQDKAPLFVPAQDLVDRAKNDLAKQQAHHARLEQELLLSQGQIERLRAFLATAAAYLNDPSISAGPIQQRQLTKTETLLRATEEEIRRAGRSLTIQELFTAMLKEGHQIGGQNPKLNYAGILSREGKGRVKYDREKGWTLDRPEQKSEPGAKAPDPLL